MSSSGKFRGKSWPAVGIDLGTTYSCVAVLQHDRVEIITNDLGNRTTPSWVAFTQTQRLVGDGAKNQASMNPANTIFDAKRLIGRKFDDLEVQDDMKLWPFTVIGQPDTDKTKKPMIVVTYKDTVKQFSPQEISSMVLMKMKESAEAYLGVEVKNAVVTVPAYFSNEQRQATKDAGTIAGLNVLHILSEPTAAAIAYGLEKKVSSDYIGPQNVLVFDLGGGTFDVSLVVIGKVVFEVKAVNGDTHLGGSDFDKRLLTYFMEEFERKHKTDMRNNRKAVGRLLAACERAKRNLSSTSETSIEIDCLFEGIDFATTITRARFEKLNMELFQKCLELVEMCLRDAQIEKTEVHEIVLVGGSTRTPMVQHLLQGFFNGKELCKGINPDEAVACGAASHAAVLAGVTGSSKHHVLVDVTPLSLGVRLNSGEMKVIIPRNSTIPTRMNDHVTTVLDYQTAVSFPVYEGERLIADENHYLGEFILNDIPPAPRGVPRFDTIFEIDADGILTVSAEDLNTKNRSHITITNHCARLSKEEIDIMMNEALMYKAHDQAYKESVESKNKLEKYVDAMKNRIYKAGSDIDLSDVADAVETVGMIGDWLEGGAYVLGDPQVFEEKFQELEGFASSFFE